MLISSSTSLIVWLCCSRNTALMESDVMKDTDFSSLMMKTQLLQQRKEEEEEKGAEGVVIVELFKRRRSKQKRTSFFSLRLLFLPHHLPRMLPLLPFLLLVHVRFRFISLSDRCLCSIGNIISGTFSSSVCLWWYVIIIHSPISCHPHLSRFLFHVLVLLLVVCR